MEKDKVIEWLEQNMNKHDWFYYEYDPNIDNLINCYYKHNNRHFCVFYKNVIEELIEKEVTIDD